MRICHLEASTGFGGQERRILLEAIGMRKRGHHILFVTEKGAQLAKRAAKEGFPCYEVRFQKKYWLYTLFRLLWIFSKETIDILNTHSSLDAWIGALAGRLLRKKILRTRHLSSPPKGGLHGKILYQILADTVLTTSQDAKNHISLFSSRPIFSIPTGIDPTTIFSSQEEIYACRTKWGVSSDHFLVGTLCVFRSWKGIDDLLQAAHLLREHPHIRFILIGGGHVETAKEKADKLHLSSTVHFTDHLENPYPALAALNLFTLLSTAHEGVSQALLQAAYLEKPLLTTPTGGLKEVCLDHETGLLVPPFSPKDVAKKILFYYENPHLCQQYGKAGRRLVEERFLQEQMLDQVEALDIYR